MDKMWIRKEFLLANGLSQLPNSSMTNDLSPYDYFEGGLDVEVDHDFSEARGRVSKKRRTPSKRTKRGGFERVMSYTPLGMAKDGIERFNSPESRERRDYRRKGRQNRRERERFNQSRNIDAVLNTTQNDAQLLAQLMPPPPPPPVKKEMSPTTKNLLIVGGISAAIIVGFVLYKKFKK
jgi:hypothetical protein